jgi:hypothetical protein
MGLLKRKTKQTVCSSTDKPKQTQRAIKIKTQRAIKIKTQRAIKIKTQGVIRLKTQQSTIIV